MSIQASTAGFFGLFLAAACGATGCGHHPAPEPEAALGRDTACVHSDSGVSLGQDVSRSRRYRVDSSGRLETLPPIPAAGTDTSGTSSRGCPTNPDMSREADTLA